MYTKEEIETRFIQTKDVDKKYYLMVHMLTPIILKDTLENCTEEEYFEGLILTSYFVLQRLSLKDRDNRGSMFTELCDYCSETKKLHDLTSGEMFDDMFQFLYDRHDIIDREISKLTNNETYLIPHLTYNLYFNPLNTESLTTHEVMMKLGEESLIFSLTFRVKFKHFLGLLDKFFPL